LRHAERTAAALVENLFLQLAVVNDAAPADSAPSAVVVPSTCDRALEVLSVSFTFSSFFLIFLNTHRLGVRALFASQIQSAIHKVLADAAKGNHLAAAPDAAAPSAAAVAIARHRAR